MYRISHLMSTQAASSSVSDKEPKPSLSPEHILPSYSYAFLSRDTSYECCSINPLTGSFFTCRRSPRLLTNGYYILTEDSFLSDDDGNVTLTPSQTSVTYKEKLVRIFRRRKKIRRSLTSLFRLSASDSWLNSTVLSNMDSPHVDETWNDGDSKLDVNQQYGNDDSEFSSECKTWMSRKQTSKADESSFPNEVVFTQPRKHFSDLSHCSQFTVDEYFHEETLGHSRSNAVRNVIYQMIMLSMCLIISVCARWFLGGRFATLLVFLLLIILVYADKSSFIRLFTSFKTTKLWK
nr:transmembrane protein 71 [Pelodiscus sinensis]XP_006123609.1 transmembrane protein 71 [Pelodiscus sinensis]XP_014429334.1 transmembrane protein 71 [Pelodiscus sinensis]XP_025040694.1 transmembrane protein 71 [Pelodiscus sinensis]XP_025040695.1 transmembrane protein 71 [Pelodiscus sinensis]|eukprot:XP_006123608.1 transmembrane protein 71 [Pelodiscus sinensis]